MSNDEPTSLQEVARAALDKHEGVSGRQLDAIAKKQGLKIVYTTINAMAAGTYKSRPGRPTLEALAELSGFTLEQVYRAARVPLPLKPFRDDLPVDADLLDGPQRRVIVDAIRLFAQQNKALAVLREEPGEGGGAHAGGAAPNALPASGPVPTRPTALRLLDATNWDPRKALVLIEGEEDSAETAVASDEIRALVTLAPAELEAARRSAEHPPKGTQEQGPD